MRRRFLLMVAGAVLAASCVPGSDGGSESVPYLDAPARVTTTTSRVISEEVAGTSEDCVVDDLACASGFVESAGPHYWFFSPSDVDALADGRLVVVFPLGVALFDPSTGWETLDLTGLPQGTPEDEWWARIVDAVAAGADGSLWVAGFSSSSVDDAGFGGTVDDWTGGRVLEWVARWDCAEDACLWTVFTANEQPGLVGGVGDLAVGADGTLFASADGNRLVTFDGTGWDSHEVPGVPGYVSPWSGSLAVGHDGVVFAGVNGDDPAVEGVLAFDGEAFVTLADPTWDWRPADMIRQVAVGSDGSLWAAIDGDYWTLGAARPDFATGLVRYDGASWTVYTMDDGLLSNDAWIATGADGTVWAIHSSFPPTGFSRFDGVAWTAYPSEQVSGGYRAAVTPDGTLWWLAEGGLMSFDGVTTMFYPPPVHYRQAPDVDRVDRFRFDRDDMCRWFSDDEVAALIAEHFDWSGYVEDAQPSDYGGCRWVLTGETEDGWLDVGDASEWQSFSGGRYEFDDREVTSYDGGLVELGSVVVGHPAISPGVVVHSGGFGMHAFGRPPGPYLSVSLQVPDAGEWSQAHQADFFSLADHLLHELGWLGGDGSPVEWGITLDDIRPGVHTLQMIVGFGPVGTVEVGSLSGELIWDETEVDLCRIGIRGAGPGYVLVGDVFQTTEGCGDNPTAMQDAFDAYGLPETGCVSAIVDGTDRQYCHPLP